MKHLLRILILALARLFGLPGAWSAARQAREPVPTVPRILLIRPDHLGDMVLTTPVLHALKTHIPNAHITMMVGPWSSEVVVRHPDIDHLLLCPFPGFQRAAQKLLAPYILLLGTAQQLRRSNFDLAINLRSDFWWGAALLYLARIPHRLGYAIAPGSPFLTRALPFKSPEPATVSSLRLASAALETLGLAPLDEPYTAERYPLQFVPTAEEQQWVVDRLAKEGIAVGTPIVVIHPGSGAEVKLWRPEAWSACANALQGNLQAPAGRGQAIAPTMPTMSQPARGVHSRGDGLSSPCTPTGKSPCNALPGLLTSPTPARIILTGNQRERPLLEEIAQGMTFPPLVLTEMTVGQLAALLQRAVLALGVDSGPLHLAVAQGTPTLHIFGPTDPRIFGPWGKAGRNVVVASTHRCPTCPSIPCGRLDFRPEELPAHPCVGLVSEQQVEAAIVSILKTQSVNIS